MLPNIASFHPQIVHFAVALLFVGVAFRLVSLTGRLTFTNHAAAVLILIGTVSAVLAVQSGKDAHGPVERIPGARAAVQKHEHDAEKTQKIFLVVGVLEVIALGLTFARRETMLRYARFAHVASALVGVFGLLSLYETAEHGGQLVYAYAGGPGLRSGDPKDVERLLLAGLYNQSRVDRQAGRLTESASLVSEMARRFPGDTNIRLLRVESLLLDAKDYPAAMTTLDSIGIAPDNARLRARQAPLKADIYVAMGNRDSARTVLAAAVAAAPQNTRLKAKLDSLDRP